MRPTYLEPDSRSRDRWMVSYLDVMTILLIFFISAAIKEQKPGAPAAQTVRSTVSAAPRAIPTETVPEPPRTTAAPPRSDLEKRLAGQGLDVHREKRGVVVSLPQAILFASGDDHISRDARPIVAKVADEIRDLPNPVVLVG